MSKAIDRMLDLTIAPKPLGPFKTMPMNFKLSNYEVAFEAEFGKPSKTRALKPRKGRKWASFTIPLRDVYLRLTPKPKLNLKPTT